MPPPPFFACLRTLAVAAAIVAGPVAGQGPAAAASTPRPDAAGALWLSRAHDDVAVRGWVWPLRGARVSQPYRAPAHAYGPGHRGVDLTATGEAGVRAPAAGVIAFAGSVAGRGILTIDHGGGLVTTLEPVTTTLTVGMVVSRGEDVATLATGGHAVPGALHLGVRRDGEYINPLLLLGGVPRAILLPCCEPLEG